MTYHPDKYIKTRHFLSAFYHKYYNGIVADEMQGDSIMLELNKIITGDKENLDTKLKQSLNSTVIYDTGIWEVIREQALFILFCKFKNRGRNIFSISDALFQLLSKTDAENITFDSIKFPYKTFYIYFGRQSSWEIEKGKYIDGAYVTVDIEDKYLQFILTTENSYVESNLNKKFIYLFDETKCIGLDFEVKSGLLINEAIQNEFVKLEESIVDRDKKNEEFLKQIEISEDHKQGIRAVRKMYKKEFETDDLNRYSKDRTYLQHFKGICSIIINSVLYLNLENKEVITKYPPTTPSMFTDELKNAKQKNKKKLIEEKIEKLGYTKIHYCGSNLPHRNHLEYGLELAPHWRRGHFRNQPFGEKRINKKIIWIEPTIVRPDKGNPEKGHIYKMNNDEKMTS